MSDLFAVGDSVTYREGPNGAALTCKIIKVMPAERYGRHYHIRDVNEQFERSVPGNTLTLIAPEPAERAFNSGVRPR